MNKITLATRHGDNNSQMRKNTTRGSKNETASYLIQVVNYWANNIPCDEPKVKVFHECVAKLIYWICMDKIMAIRLFHVEVSHIRDTGKYIKNIYKWQVCFINISLWV